MHNITYITNTATTIMSIIVFQILSAFNDNYSDTENGLFVFVCWFFVFIIGLYLSSYLPERFGPYVSYFSFSLMMDGILILTGTLFILWIFSLFSENSSYDAPIKYFSIYYFVFATLIKTISQKKFLMNISRIGLILLFFLLVAHILPLPGDLQQYAFILAGFDATLLMGILLYYFLNRMLSDLVPQNPNFTKRS